MTACVFTRLNYLHMIKIFPSYYLTHMSFSPYFSQVDKYQNTSASNIYALGDVCGNVELTPMAIAAARRLADRCVCYVVCIYGLLCIK